MSNSQPPYPYPVLQHLKFYEQFDTTLRDDATQSAVNAGDNKPTSTINYEALFYHLHDVYQFRSADTPGGIGFEQHGAKISLICGGVPPVNTLLAIFAMIQTKLTALELEGIANVVFNASTKDEVTYYNVSSILQPNENLIPAILSHVQLIHSNVLTNTPNDH
ncbi:hypothetical protein ACFPAF_01710 [Hymenobacter endophyticus]|uniref:Uncharacterized protein n=1 Tax=Hymenobacter endophyticus TaxID=3076335 RepID=A0ABU3TCK1_9BACT|nr:hypothetical protein [Hymenobacter endophyticus]MDU0369094.1 hypothetical protein [Hymenobacter endophyticus]